MNSSFSVGLLNTPYLTPFVKDTKRRRLPSLPVQMPTVDSLLDKIKHRKQPMRRRIEPELAAIVVKDYILPLFDVSKHSEFDRQRLEKFGLQNQSCSGSIYNELKLSTILQEKLEQLKPQLEQFKSKTNDAIQSAQAAEKDRFEAQKRYEETLSNFELFKFEHNMLLINTQKHMQHLELLNSQIAKLRGVNQKYMAKIERIQSLLHEERIKNDKLKNSTIELAYINDLLKMENEIMGEKLKGIYESLYFVTGNSSSEVKLRHEHKEILRSAASLSTDYELLVSELNKLVRLQNGYTLDLQEMTEMYEQGQAQKQAFTTFAKEKFENFDYTIKRLSEELQIVSTLSEDQKQDIRILTNEREKLRAQVKAYQKLNKDKNDSLVCKNCRNRYFESENFNWSCKRHFSPFSGEFYWCCGRKGENAPGCLTSEHQSSENQDEITKNTEKLQCASCKSTEHETSMCPLDPNTRTGFDPVEEFERISHLNKKKGLSSYHLSELTKKMLSLIEEVHEVKESEPVSQPRFTDIMLVKEALSFEENKVNSTQNRIKLPHHRHTKNPNNSKDTNSCK